MSLPSLDLHSLRQAYADGSATPEGVIDGILARIERRGDDHVWILKLPREHLLTQLARQRERVKSGAVLPLFGVPFAVKDNIDVAALPTTAACPQFSYVAKETAPAVQRLLDAGAILIGKTNLDQFAAGLVGVRSPYGAPASVFDRRYISGGSSSGSAVSVAAGLVSFAYGTDTAGSGRVPAGFNNLVGWKPTRGLLSTRGVVPACRSLDCVSVFALTCADAQVVAGVVGAFDAGDPFSRVAKPTAAFPKSFRFGVPRSSQLEFFGDSEAEQLFREAVTRLTALGGIPVEIDFTAFRETANLLYSGPWIAERLAAIQSFFDEHPDALHPVTAKIIGGGARYSAVDTFTHFYRLEALRRETEPVWKSIDVMVVPTSGTTYTIEQVEADPLQLNTNLGAYTNFVNLLDLCGVAVPAGFRPNGLPFGITFLAPAFADDAVLALGSDYHSAQGGQVGATGVSVNALPKATTARSAKQISLAVVGAHLTGQPLNHQLTRRGARLTQATRTAPGYQLFALQGTVPPKPGLARAPRNAGPGIEVEVWQLEEEAFGSFVAEVPAPLAIGNVELADGTVVKGFVCEPFALDKAEEITRFRGWRAYLGSLSADKGQTPGHAADNARSALRPAVS